MIFQALIGTTVQVPTLDHRILSLKMNDVIKPTTQRRIQGEGLPLPKQVTRRGDLIIEFEIIFPDHVSDSAKQILSDLLPRTGH